jgi:hypothetical protein
MTDQPPVDLACVVATLLEQQTAMLQQQTALLQVHGESVRLQRLLAERLLGKVPDTGIFWACTTTGAADCTWSGAGDQPSATSGSTAATCSTWAVKSWCPASGVHQRSRCRHGATTNGDARVVAPAARG